MTLIFTLHHSNKENQPSTALSQKHRQATLENPYVTRKKVLTGNTRTTTAKPSCTSGNNSWTKSLTTIVTKHTSTAIDSISQINEDSPTIKRILAATGHASVEEFLASRNTNLSQAPATNGANSATTNRNKATTKGSKSTNGSKAAPNVAKNSAKSTKGLTNPKKKAKSKQFA